MREELRSGRHALDEATSLLRRVRRAHPTAGLYEAADVHWAWRIPRPTDTLPQVFWFDDRGRPEAAVVAIAEGDRTLVIVITMPEMSPVRVAGVVERGLAHLDEVGIGPMYVEIDRDDDVSSELFGGHGFELDGDGVVEAWLDADLRPAIGPLPEGYRSSSRLDTATRPHHLIGRNGADVEQRLHQSSLYRADLDLCVVDAAGGLAGYGLFWIDPDTATGLVEPMRTEDDHRRRGIARHVLTTGIDRLADAGARRIKVCYEPGNRAAAELYLSAGFEPCVRTDVYAR